MYIRIYNPDEKTISFATPFGCATVVSHSFTIVGRELADHIAELCPSLERTDATEEEFKKDSLVKNKESKELAKKLSEEADRQTRIQEEKDKRSAKKIAAKNLADKKVAKDLQAKQAEAVDAELSELATQAKKQVSRYDTHEVRAADTVNKLAAYAKNKKGKKL